MPSASPVAPYQQFNLSPLGSRWLVSELVTCSVRCSFRVYDKVLVTHSYLLLRRLTSGLVTTPSFGLEQLEVSLEWGKHEIAYLEEAASISPIFPISSILLLLLLFRMRTQEEGKTIATLWIRRVLFAASNLGPSRHHVASKLIFSKFGDTFR